MFLEELCLLPSYCSERDRLFLTTHQILKDLGPGSWHILYLHRNGCRWSKKNPAGELESWRKDCDLVVKAQVWVSVSLGLISGLTTGSLQVCRQVTWSSSILSLEYGQYYSIVHVVWGYLMLVATAMNRNLSYTSLGLGLEQGLT